MKKRRRIDWMNIEKSSSYFYALIIKAVLVFVLRLFVRMNWMRNFNWDSDKSKLAKDKSNLTSANLSCTWQFQLEEVTTCKLKKTLSIEKVSKWVGNSPILSGNPVYRFIRVGLICTSQNVDGVCSCAAWTHKICRCWILLLSFISC